MFKVNNKDFVYFKHISHLVRGFLLLTSTNISKAYKVNGSVALRVGHQQCLNLASVTCAPYNQVYCWPRDFVCTFLFSMFLYLLHI